MRLSCNVWHENITIYVALSKGEGGGTNDSKGVLYSIEMTLADLKMQCIL